MVSLIYINSKLSDALYTLTVHEGDARIRLAKVIPIIMHLPTPSFPIELQEDFEWVKATIKRGIGVSESGFAQPIPPPSKLTGIHNSTASKVIKKLLYIQDEINSQVESELDFD